MLHVNAWRPLAFAQALGNVHCQLQRKIVLTVLLVSLPVLVHLSHHTLHCNCQMQFAQTALMGNMLTSLVLLGALSAALASMLLLLEQ
jgi:hypothetical protein